MLSVWVHGCDPGRLSDGLRLALYQTLSIECPSSIFFFSGICFVLLFLSFCRFCLALFSCFRWSFVDVPLIYFLSNRPRTGLATTYITGYCCLKKNQNAPRLSEHPPVRGEKMSKRLGGIIGCKYKTSSWHLNGFPDGNNIESTV